MSHQIQRITWGDLDEEIDTLIAPLVLACWRAGIRTFDSCQERTRGYADIAFETARDAELFLNLIRVGAPELDLRPANQRMPTVRPTMIPRPPTNVWAYEMMPRFNWDPVWLQVTILVPHTDLQRVQEALETAPPQALTPAPRTEHIKGEA